MASPVGATGVAGAICVVGVAATADPCVGVGATDRAGEGGAVGERATAGDGSAAGEGGTVGGGGGWETGGNWVEAGAGATAGAPVGFGFRYFSPTTYPTTSERTNNPMSVTLMKRVFCRTPGLFGTLR